MLIIFLWIKFYLIYKNIYVYIYIYMEFFILKKFDYFVNY